MKNPISLKLALTGVISGLLVTAQTNVCLADESQFNRVQSDKTNKENGTSSLKIEKAPQKILTDSELRAKLSREARDIYDKLDQEGKALALKLANQDCKGKNDCKGLNSCATTNNACAGEGGCKGTTPGPFSNKDDAVRIADKKMALKRAASSKKTTSSNTLH